MTFDKPNHKKRKIIAYCLVGSLFLTSLAAVIYLFQILLVPKMLAESLRDFNKYDGPSEMVMIIGTLRFRDFINHHKSGIHEIEFWITVDKILPQNSPPIAGYPNIDWPIIQNGYLDESRAFRLSKELESLNGKKIALSGTIYLQCGAYPVIMDTQDSPSCIMPPATHIPLYKTRQEKNTLEFIDWPEESRSNTGLSEFSVARYV